MCQPRQNAACRLEQLASQCGELSHDPLAWNRHMLAGLLPLVAGSVAAAMCVLPDAAGEMTAVFSLDLGWTNAKSRSLYYAQLVANNGFRRMATFQRLMAHSGDVVVCRRAQLVPDRQWYRSAEYRETWRPLGLDDLLAARVQWPTGGGGAYIISLSRRLNEPPFGMSECELVLEFCRRLVSRLSWAPAHKAVGIYSGLPRRLQATLRCLLDGDSEKQAAARLGLSRFTLHDYVCDLYQHFGVNSRPELLARSYVLSPWSARAEHQPLQCGLPQRLQEVLERLLAGDSEKQVAHRLRLSQHTVHEYVTSLYRRFGVHSRAQLLVTCRRERAA